MLKAWAVDCCANVSLLLNNANVPWSNPMLPIRKHRHFLTSSELHDLASTMGQKPVTIGEHIDFADMCAGNPSTLILWGSISHNSNPPKFHILTDISTVWPRSSEEKSQSRTRIPCEPKLIVRPRSAYFYINGREWKRISSRLRGTFPASSTVKRAQNITRTILLIR